MDDPKSLTSTTWMMMMIVTMTMMMMMMTMMMMTMMMMMMVRMVPMMTQLEQMNPSCTWTESKTVEIKNERNERKKATNKHER
jgi:cell division protein FtsL